jgi:microcin C transport system substrate-binding protein
MRFSQLLIVSKIFRQNTRMSEFIRTFLLTSLIVIGAFQPAFAEHGMGMGYAPKYPAGFKHFDYVNPTAPKGGSLSLSAIGTFNKLNPFVLKGQMAAGMGWSANGFVFAESGLYFDSLTAPSEDEPFTRYGLLAEDMVLAPDRLSITFKMNPKARFSNGDPVLAKDVKHSFDTLIGKGATPTFKTYWADVKTAVVIDERTIRFDFKRVNSELHMVVGQLPVFSHKWPGIKKLDEAVLEAPIASGPYKIESYDLGKTITYVRNKDYWAVNHPTRVGFHNFDRVSYSYFRDPTGELEAVNAGQFDAKDEGSITNWVRRYSGKAFSTGVLRKDEFKHTRNTGMQGLVFNLRRDKFKDIRVRQAIGLAFDFEWLNNRLFFNRRLRTESYFNNNPDLMAQSVPDQDEMLVWDSLKTAKPAGLFAPLVRSPKSPNPAALRANLKLAQSLLKDAGWVFKDGALRDKDGKALELEFLYSAAAVEPVLSPFARNLEKLGIAFKYKRTDSAIIQKREAEFDFDMTVSILAGSSSPGNELYDDFSSSSAKTNGSGNLVGVSDPLIDELIEVIVQSPDRKRLSAAARAFDRLLLKNYFLVPMYYSGQYFVASKPHLGHTKDVPPHSLASIWITTMWWDKGFEKNVDTSVKKDIAK